MKLSACETIVDEEKFVAEHKATIKAFEERTKHLHKVSREWLEWRIEPYRRRLAKYYELKKNGVHNQ